MFSQVGAGLDLEMMSGVFAIWLLSVTICAAVFVIEKLIAERLYRS